MLFRSAQILDHILAGNVRAEQGVDALRLQRERYRLGNVVQNVDHAVHDFARAKQFDQFARTVDSGNGQHRVDILFKLCRSICAHAECQRCLADGRAEEVGRFKYDIDRIGYDEWDPFQKPNDPMDIRVDPSKRTTQQLFRGFMHSLGERTEGNDFNKGALDCALGIVNRDERYLGIYEFCVWYYKLLKKEGLIDEGPVRES